MIFNEDVEHISIRHLTVGIAAKEDIVFQRFIRYRSTQLLVRCRVGQGVVYLNSESQLTLRTVSGWTSVGHFTR